MIYDRPPKLIITLMSGAISKGMKIEWFEVVITFGNEIEQRTSRESKLIVFDLVYLCVITGLPYLTRLLPEEVYSTHNINQHKRSNMIKLARIKTKCNEMLRIAMEIIVEGERER